jgi:ribosomal protein L28
VETCSTKKSFDSYKQAWKTRRKWQSAGRKFDEAHIYKCDLCSKFHIGRKHDAMKHGRTRRTMTPDVVREQLIDDLDNVFDAQLVRIVGRLSRSERRIRNANMKTIDTGSLIRPETATYAFAGDDLDVENR